MISRRRITIPELTENRTDLVQVSGILRYNTGAVSAQLHQMNKLLAFDLDGTLIDSGAICTGINLMRERTTPPLPETTCAIYR